MKQHLFFVHRFFMVLFVVAGIFFIAEKSFAQSEFPNKEVTMTINNNDRYLKTNAVSLVAGFYPYTENGKWGIKKTSGEIFLPVVYDSILNADVSRFITVKDARYQLMDYDLWNWFDSSVVNIRFNSSESYPMKYTVTDDQGRTSSYQLTPDSRKIIPLETVNHLHPNPDQNGNFPAYSTFYTPNNQITRTLSGNYSCKYEVNPVSNKTELIFYNNNQDFWRKPVDFTEYSFYGEHYVCFKYYGDNKIYDLNDTSLVFSVKAREFTYFECDGNGCFFASDIPDQHNLSKVFDTKGNLLRKMPGEMEYFFGLFLKKLDIHHPEYIQKYDIYTLPGYQLSDSNVIIDKHWQERTLFTHRSDQPDYKLYTEGKLIYSFRHIGKVELEPVGLNKETHKGLIAFKTMNAKEKNPRYYLVSTQGTLFATSKYRIAAGFDDYRTKNITVSFYQKGESEPYRIGIYDPEKDLVNVIPFRPESWEQINPDTMLYHDYFTKGHWIYSSNACYFLDLKGNCINDEAYSDYHFCPLTKNDKLIELTQNGVPAIYNTHLLKLCDSCYFRDFPYTSVTDKNFVVINKNANEPFVQVVDNNLNSILPGKYLAVQLMRNYFAVLTEDYSIEYISLSTEKYRALFPH